MLIRNRFSWHKIVLSNHIYVHNMKLTTELRDLKIFVEKLRIKHKHALLTN